MRKNEKIFKHSHASNNWDYLSGHICVSTKETYTHYIDPFFNKVFSSKNEVGKITLFPSWIKHYTDEVKNEEKRITIAFDIRNEESYNVDIFDIIIIANEILNENSNQVRCHADASHDNNLDISDILLIIN